MHNVYIYIYIHTHTSFSTMLDKSLRKNIKTEKEMEKLENINQMKCEH